MRTTCLLALMAALAALPAAADDFIKGVYLQSEELCAQAKSDSLQTVIEAGNILLTARGLESIEYNCEFVEITRGTRAPAWVVTALCQEPGYVFPDVLSITELNDTQLDLASVRAADEEGGTSGNAGTYYLCDGVGMP